MQGRRRFVKMPARTQRFPTPVEATGLLLVVIGLAVGLLLVESFLVVAVIGALLLFLGAAVERVRADRLFREENDLPPRTWRLRRQ